MFNLYDVFINAVLTAGIIFCCVLGYTLDRVRDNTEALETRITKLERSIPIPPLTTEEAVELMEGLD